MALAPALDAEWSALERQLAAILSDAFAAVSADDAGAITGLAPTTTPLLDDVAAPLPEARARRAIPAEASRHIVTASVDSTEPTNDDTPSTTPTQPHHADDPLAQLGEILRALGTVADSDWHTLGGQRAHEALDVLETIERRLAAVRADVVNTIDSDGLWALDGQRTFRSWLQERTGTTPAAASRQVRHSRALRDLLPLTHQALADGSISQEHVAALVREATVTDRLRAQLSDATMGEAFLVEQAQAMHAGSFTKLVKTWAVQADPEAADRNWRDSGAKEELTLSPTLDGFHVAGWLSQVSGQVVQTALAAHMGRKGKDDERTPAQRRAAALVSLAHQSLDLGEQQSHARIRPHLTVTVSWETFEALVAASGSVIPPRRSDGRPHNPDSSMSFDADSTLTALGGPRDPGAQGNLFHLSDDARQWLADWQPGQDVVIPAAIDYGSLTGVEPATLEDGAPVAPSLLARLACDSSLSRVVFGPESTILDVGREKRIFPANMVKAIVARDRHCQYPGCDEPPGFGEIHHALQWYRDQGPTSVEHGILLCWNHHDWVHAQGITIVRSDGAWYFHNRHGWLIAD